MTQKEVLDELKALIVERLKFDPRRAAEMTAETTLPKGLGAPLGLDSLDFIELSVAIEERFGVVIDETESLTDEFLSLDSPSRFALSKVKCPPPSYAGWAWSAPTAWARRHSGQASPPASAP